MSDIKKRELASVEAIEAFAFRGHVLFIARGEKPTPCHRIDIDQLPIEILPPHYAVQWWQTAVECAQVITPYVYAEAFPLPEHVPELTVLTKESPHGGKVPVLSVEETSLTSLEPCERLGRPNGDPSHGRTAIGYSNRLSFDEAFAAAIEALPPPQRQIPDWLTTVQVERIWAELGGIAGLRRLAVRVSAR